MKGDDDDVRERERERGVVREGREEEGSLHVELPEAIIS